MTTKPDSNTQISLIPHRSAPKPETLTEMTGMRLATAKAVRELIKDTSKEEILTSGRFPKTAKDYSPSTHTDDDLMMMAICECVGGEEVRKIPVQTPTKSYHLHHVVMSDPSKRSIGLNDDWRNFYVRSLQEVMANLEHRHHSVEQPGLDR